MMFEYASAEPDSGQPHNRSDDTDAKSIKGNGPHDRHTAERCDPVSYNANGSEASIDGSRLPKRPASTQRRSTRKAKR
jgi:hypothetical protein